MITIDDTLSHFQVFINQGVDGLIDLVERQPAHFDHAAA